MRIAMIGHKRIPSREGGIEVVVGELARRLAAQGHTVHAYNRAGGHVSGAAYTRSKDWQSVRLITVPTIPAKGLDAMVYSLLATLRALFGRYDVIHFHAEGPSAMLPLARLFGIRTVATVHGLDWQRGKWGGFAARYIRFGERMLARYANEVVVLSEANRRYFKEIYGRDTRLIPNGMDTPTRRAPNLITSQYGLCGGDYVLFLARLVPEKGLHYLLDAFAQIPTDMRLVVAGGSSHSDAYAEQMRRMAADDPRVCFIGFVQGEVLSELYSNCALYVLPSDIEGMPLTLLEAMSYGCRCLVSDIEENTEVAGQYAQHFAHGNRQALQEALAHMLQEETADCAQADLPKHFNWDSVAETYAVLYEQLS